MQIGLTAAFVLVALLTGGLAALNGGVLAFTFVGALILAVVLLRNYRVGVIILVIVVPFIGIHDQGSNVFMLTLVATLVAFLLTKLFTRDAIVSLPKVVWLGMVVTVAWGAILTSQHLAEARAVLAGSPEAVAFSLNGFFRNEVLAPFGIITVAWLLGNAVFDSKKPELFLIVIGAVGCVIGLQIINFVVTSGMSLSELGDSRNREVFGQLGHHANAFGPMLAVAAGPFLFLTADGKGWPRVFYGAVLLTLLTGCALVFSRGGYLAFAVEFSAFLLMRRRLKIFLGVAIVSAVVLLVMPGAVRDRATLGLDSSSLAMVVDRRADDPLTAGRFAIYEVFVPEIAKSPLWGSGIGSAVWSDAFRNGWTTAAHPHNTYLRALMDIGALGLMLLAYFWRGIALRMRELSNSPELSPVMRSYFAGAFASILGLMAAWISGGPHWLPDAGQPFLWYSIGMTLAFWRLHDTAPQKSAPALGKAPPDARPQHRVHQARRAPVGSTLGR